MPEFKKLMKQGSWSLSARTVLLSSSAVNWASMLMGAGSTEHGFTEWGSKVPEIESVTKAKYGLFPSIFSAVRDQKPDAKTTVVYTWGGIKYLIEQDAIDFVATGADDFTADTAATIAWILGLKEPQPWRGKPVLSAFK